MWHALMQFSQQKKIKGSKIGLIFSVQNKISLFFSVDFGAKNDPARSWQVLWGSLG